MLFNVEDLGSKITAAAAEGEWAKQEIGFRTAAVGPPARYQEVDAEALMLTGDENIVKLEFIVQYKVRADATGASDFLFNVRDPEETLRASAEAAMSRSSGAPTSTASSPRRRRRCRRTRRRCCRPSSTATPRGSRSSP